MKWTVAALAAIAIASCATTPPPVVGFAPFCTAEGALGQRFGPAPDFDGETSVLAHTRDAAAAPFYDLQLGRSRLTGVTHTISAYTTLYTGDSVADIATAEQVYNQFRARVEASGVFRLGEETRYGAEYFAVTGTPPLRLSLGYSGGVRVSMTCRRPDLFQVAWREMPDDVRGSAEEALRRLEHGETTAPETPQQ